MARCLHLLYFLADNLLSKCTNCLDAVTHGSIVKVMAGACLTLRADCGGGTRDNGSSFLAPGSKPNLPNLWFFSLLVNSQVDYIVFTGAHLLKYLLYTKFFNIKLTNSTPTTPWAGKNRFLLYYTLHQSCYTKTAFSLPYLVTGPDRGSGRGQISTRY